MIWRIGGVQIQTQHNSTHHLNGLSFGLVTSSQEENYDTLRNRLESGKPIALSVSLPIYRLGENKRKERYPTDSSFTILLRKDQSYGRSDAIWIRRYLSVPKTAYLPTKNGFISIIISEDGILEELLRKSEEVAHTQHRYTRINSQYHSARDIVDFYRKSAQYISNSSRSRKRPLRKTGLMIGFHPKKLMKRILIKENGEGGKEKS